MFAKVLLFIRGYLYSYTLVARQSASAFKVNGCTCSEGFKEG